jgi:hypothetical protein
VSKPSFSEKNHTQRIRRGSLERPVEAFLTPAAESTSVDVVHHPSVSDRVSIVKLFLIVTAISLLLRIFYSSHLYQDEGFWFTTAEEILRGKALYREIYFDKPPILPITYALLLKLFGAHILTIRIFTAIYCVAVSLILYRFGSMLYGKRTGMIAAGLFVLFSTTYTTGHVQSLSTDLLMLLPYTAGSWLLTRSAALSDRASDLRRPYWLAWAGGVLVGIAFQVNPKAIFDLIFYAALLVILSPRIQRTRLEINNNHSRANSTPTSHGRRALLFCTAVVGVASASLPFMAYLFAENALTEYWRYVWVWGSRYASYYPVWTVFVSAVRQSVGYFALNNMLLIGLVVVLVAVMKSQRRKSPPESDSGELQEAMTSPVEHPAININRYQDVALLIWFGVSYVALAVGGRFFGHYFLLIVPALCLITGRGLLIIFSSISNRTDTGHTRLRRGLVTGVLLLALAFTVVRFHARTAVLAVDWVRGTKSSITENWYHDRLNRDERTVAAEVRDLHESEDSLKLLGVEEIRRNSPEQGEKPEDYLFVWGYRPEIYYWSGLRPASRYLSTQPLTGIPADIHYFEQPHRILISEQESAEARSQLVKDLEQTAPKYIIDELGAFNWDLSLNQYPELREFMKQYKLRGQSNGFTVYRHRDFAPRERNKSEGAADQ